MAETPGREALGRILARDGGADDIPAARGFLHTCADALSRGEKLSDDDAALVAQFLRDSAFGLPPDLADRASVGAPEKDLSTAMVVAASLRLFMLAGVSGVVAKRTLEAFGAGSARSQDRALATWEEIAFHSPMDDARELREWARHAQFWPRLQDLDFTPPGADEDVVKALHALRQLLAELLS